MALNSASSGSSVRKSGARGSKMHNQSGLGSVWSIQSLTSGDRSREQIGAKASTEIDEIVENITAAIDGILEFVPKKLSGVRSLYLKFSESVALPLYQFLPANSFSYGFHRQWK
ncbi:hypothetical protein L2E82_25849 [Cichorium intybus]|uniref:Uncharacterized protein n=1 Tax=Cichorium intybus TaxID=13427 RepID=A0ACB9E560_CICIN|nr:hypothetical protein L2E82_25849 [Cichorium intybus]